MYLKTVSSNGSTYTLIGDANNGWAGVPGSFTPNPVWLYQSSDPAAGAPIRDLFVEIDGDLTAMTGTGWERVQWTSGGYANLNQGRGWECPQVYLWMRR